MATKPDTPLLEIRKVSRSFFDVPVLREVSFSLRRGEVLGLVGENGAGKSTLMNILGGVLEPDSGTVLIGGQDFAPRDVADATASGVAFIHQELNLFGNLSVAENLFLSRMPRRIVGGVRLPFVHAPRLRAAARERLAEVGLAVDPRTPVARLAPGERQLVEIARALGTDARIIILDEPTTSLTRRESERLFRLIARLKERGVASIYISHDLGDVFQLCDRLVVLRDGEVVGDHGRQQCDLDAVIASMVGREIRQLYPDRLSRPGEEVLLEARSVSRAGLVRDVSFQLHAGEVLGLSGLMGSGRTELARILFGLEPLDSGEIELDGRRIDSLSPRQRIARGLAYLTEDRREEGLMMEASLAENVSLAALDRFAPTGGILRGRAISRAVHDVAVTVKLAGAGLATRPVKTLSGGNQQKVVLAKWLLRGARVFLLDEPTRGIDVGARHEIYRLIDEVAARGSGVLLISSELEELIGMCDRILVLQGGRQTACLPRESFDREDILKSALRGGTFT